MDKTLLNEVMLTALRKIKGIVAASCVADEDRQQILDIELDAEEKSMMGLGKVINTGVRKVLNADAVYVALTNMDFDLGCRPTLVVKKDQEIVGEEVRDEERLAALSNQKDVWFLHKNFVIYKNKISFPHDIMKKICYFETPSIPAEWCILEDDTIQCRSIVYANPVTPTDILLKNRYFDGLDEQGLGTILIGVEL